MNILVTGGCGFIGSRLCEELVDLGHWVINLDSLTYAANEPRARELMAACDNYQLYEGDVRDWKLVYELLREFEIELVMHLAAESHVDRSISGPQTFLEANVLGTYGILEAIRAYLPKAPKKFRLLHVSTDEVFGDMPLKSTELFDENSYYRPSSPYSASKAAGDWLVRSWGRTFGVPWVMTHGANAYGPGQLPDKLIPMAITNGIKGTPITLHGNGMNVRSWLHVDDHARGLIAVAMNGKINNNYCLCGDAERSNQYVVEFVRTTLQLKGYNPIVQNVDDRPGNDLRYGMSSEKVFNHTRWEATVDFTKGLTSTINWFINKEKQNG